MNLFSLSGEVALVTGAAEGGLGAAAARVLGEHGATVVVTDIAERADDLAATVERLRPSCPGLSAAVLDVTDEIQVKEVAGRVRAKHGWVDILVNAAGIMLRRAIDETSRAEFERVMEVNVTGTWMMCRTIAPGMADRGSGKIINFSSVYADRVGPIPESAYYASKAAVANLTRSLASEFGPAGVQVNCLAPGVFFPTRMTAPLAEDPEALERFSDRTLLKRLGDPDRDLDGPVLLLASSGSDYITGQTLFVDGGWSAW